MNGSWKLGEIAGISVRMHWTFLLLPLWAYYSTLSAGAGISQALSAALFVLAIFACVLLHELGHAFAARRYGIGTRDITLLPIGGVAALERMPRQPQQELVIALAGPLVNGLIAAVLLGVLPNLVSPGYLRSSWAGMFLSQLAWVNVALVVFNLVPAFPMDGGRVLRALLAFRWPYVTATQVAARVGQTVAIAMGVYGLLSGNLMLMLVSGFIFLAAANERMLVVADHRRSTTRTAAGSGDSPWRFHAGWSERSAHRSGSAAGDGLDFGRVEPTRPAAGRAQIPAEMSAESAMRWLQWHGAEECSVVSHGAVVGRLRRFDLLRAIANGWGGAPIVSLLRS